MTRFTLYAGATAYLLLSLTACKTTLEIRQVKPNDKINGIPFRIKKPYTLFVYKNFGSAENPDYRVVHKDWKRLPDMKQLYTANFSAGYFAEENLTLKFNPDNTLQTVDLKSGIKVDEALATLAGQVSAVDSKIRATRAATRNPSQIDRALTDEKTAKTIKEYYERIGRPPADEADRETAFQNAYTALLDADLAQAKYDAVIANPEATETMKVEALNELGKAQYAANLAHKKAGLEEPYPGLFP